MIYYSNEVNFINENILGEFKKNILNNLMINFGNEARYINSHLNKYCLIFIDNSKDSIKKIVSIIYNNLQNKINKINKKGIYTKIVYEKLYNYNIILNFGSKILLKKIFPYKLPSYYLDKIIYKSHVINFSKLNESELSNEIIISSDSLDGLLGYIFYIQTSINDNLKYEPFPDNFYDNFLNLYILFFKNKVIRLSSCIPSVEELEWINNSFDNIFRYEIFRNAIENSKFLKINYIDKKVYYYILNPEDDLYDEDEEMLNNIIKDYIVTQPKYNIKNLVINETIVNTILPQIKKKLNVQAKEWIPGQ
jgi:hypothetical protein